MAIQQREVDDGYRGLLRNPETGRTFYANAHTALRYDLERIESKDQTAFVSTSKPAIPKKDREVAQVVAKNEDDATEALTKLAADVEATDDKQELKALAKTIGLKFTINMNVDTMKHRIARQIDAIVLKR